MMVKIVVINGRETEVDDDYDEGAQPVEEAPPAAPGTQSHAVVSHEPVKQVISVQENMIYFDLPPPEEDADA